MGRKKKGESNGYITPYGKKVIAIHVPPEIEEKILACARKKGLTRQSYLINIINADLDKMEKENVE